MTENENGTKTIQLDQSNIKKKPYLQRTFKRIIIIPVFHKHACEYS